MAGTKKKAAKGGGKGSKSRPAAPGQTVGKNGAQVVDPKRVKSGTKTGSIHPWDAVLAAYCAPTVSPDGNNATWPTLVAVAERFGISYQMVKERSAAHDWTEKQAQAMDAWWAALSKELNRRMVRAAASARMAAFASGVRAIQVANGQLNGTPDSATAFRASGTVLRGLDAVMKAAGVPDPTALAEVGVKVSMDGQDLSVWALLRNRRSTVGAQLSLDGE